MSMSPRCHEAVPVPETASTPLVEALPQIFRRVLPREIQADREALLMSILTTELLQKLGTYCPLRVPFRLKNAFYCFSMLMVAELPQGHEKFDLSYFDNVVVFLEGWGFPIDHMDGILELNTHLAVRPAEFELAQEGVEYCSHVVGLGKQSPAQLKVRAIIDFSISRYKTQVKVWEYDRQYIPMFSRLITPVTEMLKRKSKKGDIKWTSECPEFFRQLEGN
ncbi:retrovirus-related Pol polyprotein from transposon 17.6 [Trichonephila clavipes]|nr:retrovirus-related Pol polyprotein from transposon 17.6 [Trichonephila clavipes]